jgi:hypothetical protein
MGSGWWCNNHLEKYEFVTGKDDIPYMKWKIKHVWNHQPGFQWIFSFNGCIHGIPAISTYHAWLVLTWVVVRAIYWGRWQSTMM